MATVERTSSPNMETSYSSPTKNSKASKAWHNNHMERRMGVGEIAKRMKNKWMRVLKEQRKGVSTLA